MLSQTINRKSHVTSADLSQLEDNPGNPNRELADHPAANVLGRLFRATLRASEALEGSSSTANMINPTYLAQRTRSCMCT
jgi:hypothetical protein